MTRMCITVDVDESAEVADPAFVPDVVRALQDMGDRDRQRVGLSSVAVLVHCGIAGVVSVELKE